jgi:hypothetical protein
MLITSEWHLRLILDEYAAHYNTHLPGRALQADRCTGPLFNALPQEV